MGRRRGWRRWFTRRTRNAWRMDQVPVPQVAWAHVPELTPRAASADVVPAPSPWPAEERLDQAMPSVYCARCGRASPEGARFCSHCGAPLVRAGAERPGESTSTISLGGADLADGDYEEPLAESAATEALPAGTALLLVKRGPNAGSRFLLDSELTTVGRHPGSDIFLDDVTVSRRHATLVNEGGRWRIEDGGSLNGTFVNRKRVDHADLEDGDEVQIGKYRMTFLLR